MGLLGHALALFVKLFVCGNQVEVALQQQFSCGWSSLEWFPTKITCIRIFFSFLDSAHSRCSSLIGIPEARSAFTRM